MIRKDFRAGISNNPGAGEKDGKRKGLVYQEGDSAYIVENHRNVKKVTIIRRRGDFYTVGLGHGGITLKSSRLYSTEEEAQNSIVHTVDTPTSERRQSEDIGMRGYPSPYSYENSRSSYGI